MDPAVLADLRLVAQAIGELNAHVFPPEFPPHLPRGEGRPPLRATVGEPALQNPAREVLFPTIPLPAIEALPPVEVDLEAPPMEAPPKVESLDDIDALAAWGERMAAATAMAGDDEATSTPTAPPAPRSSDAEAIDAVFGVAPPAAQVVWSRARSFFEDIAMMGIMRRPGPFSVWYHFGTVEQRLLARVDAILACGPWVLPRLVQLLEDRPIPDPELLW